MTDRHDRAVPPVPEDEMIDGHSVDELDDYLAAGRQPYNASIENSASCLLYLSALARLRNRSWNALTTEAAASSNRDDKWISGLLDTIKNEVRAGRDIPVSHPDPTIRLTITEAAVHGLIRGAADSLDGVILGRSVLEGDITLPDEPIAVSITIAAEYGRALTPLAERLRLRIGATLRQHTELVIASISVTIEDIYTGKDARL